jgi:acyl-CoA synthetase (AMP-forming)/AMP-acid ligase II
MLTHRGLVANLIQLDAATVGEVRLQADDVVLGILPFFHAFGMLIVMNHALRRGATVVEADVEKFKTGTRQLSPLH